jgi:sporulation protein YlmC with PRC-barrel domain
MKKTLLTAVSAIAITMTAPAAFAGEMKVQSSTDVKAERTHNQNDIEKERLTEEEVREGWEDTKDAVSDAANDVAEATEDTYESIKATVVGSKKGSPASTITVDMRMTADGMLGKPVYNENGDRVAKIQDIILNKDGDAMMIVMADGAFTGLGKNVAFDYSVITRQTAEGDLIVALTEEMIDNAASFSYDQDDYSEDVRVIPSNGYSTAKLLDGALVNPKGEKLADIDNISFKNGEADQLIVGFDKTLGLGGEKAALAYNDVELAKDGETLNFKISASQETQFEAFKNSY